MKLVVIGVILNIIVSITELHSTDSATQVTEYRHFTIGLPLSVVKLPNAEDTQCKIHHPGGRLPRTSRLRCIISLRSWPRFCSGGTAA